MVCKESSRQAAQSLRSSCACSCPMCRAVAAPNVPADGVVDERAANDGRGAPLGSGWLSIIGGGTILGGLVGITMYVKHRSRRDAVTPASDDYHRLTEPRR